jgi:hypothetical protein
MAATLCGAIVGAAIALLGLPVTGLLGSGSARGIAVVTGLAVGLCELLAIGMRMPQRHKQVPSSWRHRFPPEIALAGYGGIIGMGIFTKIPFASFYVLIVWTLLEGSVEAGAITLAVYGLSRAGASSIIGVLRPTSGAEKIVERAMRMHQTAGRLGGAALVLLSLSLVWLVAF